mmetsp:Transcript_104149/g.206897  ORF Transcript_104149/g.206897 Transcript_104149/m.206897 type:complete len:430 (+) Transcript_104149:78-1367(+)
MADCSGTDCDGATGDTENLVNSHRDGKNIILHVRKDLGSGYVPMSVNAADPVEFQLDNFRGRCLFLHRPAWSYDSPADEEAYPYRSHFHGRKRLWEWRLQGKFLRKPGTVYCGIELEEYVPVNFATRAMMRAILPLIQGALQCNLVHHEIGRADDKSLRPVVVAPIWCFDSTLVHENPDDAPKLGTPTLPTGLSRKAARQFWESVWSGGPSAWDRQADGPTFTFALWGPSPLLDLRAWAFRRLPLMRGRELAMEPFCGQQSVHGVIYELQANERGDIKHVQPSKIYSADIRMMPEALWQSKAVGEESPKNEECSATLSGTLDALDMSVPAMTRQDSSASFCSALSGSGSPRSEHNATEEDLLQAAPSHFGIPEVPTSGLAQSSQGDPDALSHVDTLPVPLVGSEDRKGTAMFYCCRRRRRVAVWETLPV